MPPATSACRFRPKNVDVRIFRTKDRLSMQRKVSRQPHPTRVPPSFETSHSVHIFDCGQNTLIVRRYGTGMSVKTLFISRIAIRCLLSSSLGRFPKSQWERNAESQSFHGNLPTPLSAQSRHFDQSSKNERPA